MERGKLLNDHPTSLGASWATSVCEAMRREHRQVIGGWPGTIPEARSRVSLYLGAELARLGMAPLTLGELGAAADVTYARARREWLEVVRNTKIQARRSLDDTRGGG